MTGKELDDELMYGLIVQRTKNAPIRFNEIRSRLLLDAKQALTSIIVPWNKQLQTAGVYEDCIHSGKAKVYLSSPVCFYFPTEAFSLLSNVVQKTNVGRKKLEELVQHPVLLERYKPDEEIWEAALHYKTGDPGNGVGISYRPSQQLAFAPDGYYFEFFHPVNFASIDRHVLGVSPEVWLGIAGQIQGEQAEQILRASLHDPFDHDMNWFDKDGVSQVERKAQYLQAHPAI